MKVRTTVTPLQRLLLEHMEATGESFADIARRGGMPRQTVQAVLYRQGHSVPLESTMEKLATGLGLPVAAIHEAVADGLAGSSADEKRHPLTTRLDPILLVLIDVAKTLPPEQRQVLLDTARSLQRASNTRKAPA
jgi:cyanate lyase